jgi:hypothetical protein
MKKRSILLFCIGFQFFISKTSAQQIAKLWISPQDSIILMKENIEFNSRFEYKNSIDLYANHIQFLKMQYHYRLVIIYHS